MVDTLCCLFLPPCFFGVAKSSRFELSAIIVVVVAMTCWSEVVILFNSLDTLVCSCGVSESACCEALTKSLCASLCLLMWDFNGDLEFFPFHTLVWTINSASSRTLSHLDSPILWRWIAWKAPLPSLVLCKGFIDNMCEVSAGISCSKHSTVALSSANYGISCGACAINSSVNWV